jgi:hypothetical protein
MTTPATKHKRSYPQWVTITIGLTAMILVKETCNVIRENPKLVSHKKESYNEWLPLETIVQKKSKEINLSEGERKKWCDCVLTKFKAKYPNGLNNLRSDSIQVNSAIFAYDCVKVAIDTIKTQVTINNDPLGLERESRRISNNKAKHD